ncbi:MAG: hypothetical protein JNK02_05115 [Planctomycetes bacterium]|nr:hypothetical protein [Planctomycetota bacterium]
MSSPVDPRFACELGRSLRDEIGARSLYRRLAAAARDEELARLLAAFAEQGPAIEDSLRRVAHGLAVRAREWSPSRWVSARVLGLAARAGIRDPGLRLGVESEEALARRYAGFADWLARTGREHEARICGELSGAKSRRARALRAWVPR